MNRRIAVWICACLLAAQLRPAPIAAGIASLGVKAGLSASRHHGDAAATDYRVGLGGGLAASIPITPRFSLQPELFYVMKGGVVPRVELVDASGAIIGFESVTYAVDYLEIPVLARVLFPTEGAPAPFITGGPSVAFKVAEEIRGGPGEDPDPRNGLVTTDVGVAIGVGLELGRGRGRWSIEARYTAGVSNALADPVGYNVRNGAFLLLAGLAWNR